MSIEKVLARFSKTIQVVEYAPEWKNQMVEIARQIHGESMYSNMPMDEEKVIRQLAACGPHLVPDRYFRLAIRGDEVLGGFYGHVRKTFFCDEIQAHDMGWWVKPSRRGSAAAIVLLADFEKWGRAQGARKLLVGQSTKRDIGRTTKLFEHCGFHIIGFNTAKDL